MASLVHQETDQVLASQVVKSHSIWKRLKGLLGHQFLDSETVMWLKPCPSIHTCFMSFPIDVIFTDKTMRVTGVAKNIPAWKIVNGNGEVINILKSLFIPRIHSMKGSSASYNAFEFKGGILTRKIQIRKGDRLNVVY